jgi:hypothetical protein
MKRYEVVKPMASSLSKYENDLKKKEAQHAKFLSQQNNLLKPKPDAFTGVVLLTGTRAVPSSAASVLGIVDGQGMTEEARAWFRESQTTDKADASFFTQKAKNSPKLWNDSGVPDSAFAADEEILDHRQNAPERPHGERYLNSMRIGDTGVVTFSSITKASTR